jgi:hypothetical protein
VAIAFRLTIAGSGKFLALFGSDVNLQIFCDKHLNVRKWARECSNLASPFCLHGSVQETERFREDATEDVFQGFQTATVVPQVSHDPFDV